MNLKDVLPMVIVVLVAAAALALGDTMTDNAVVAQKRPEVAPARWFPAAESLSPNEVLVSTAEMPSTAETPVEPLREAGPTAIESKPAKAARPHKRALRQAPVVRSRIVVEQRRLGADQRLNVKVVDAIANAPNIAGKIGVQTRSSAVRLSGWTMTAAMSARAERAASRVKGVKQVVNEIRPRIGAVTS